MPLSWSFIFSNFLLLKVKSLEITFILRTFSSAQKRQNIVIDLIKLNVLIKKHNVYETLKRRASLPLHLQIFPFEDIEIV